MEKCKDKKCKSWSEFYRLSCIKFVQKGVERCPDYLKAQKESVAEVPCSDGLCAELSLMLDVFNSCIETKTLPTTGSPCQEKIIELLKQCGKTPTALKVRGA